MSAFFVACAIIDAAVSAFIVKDGPLSLDAATALGHELWAINAEVVRRHYNTVRPHASLGYKPPAPEVIIPALSAWPAAPTPPASPARLPIAPRPRSN